MASAVHIGWSNESSTISGDCICEAHWTEYHVRYHLSLQKLLCFQIYCLTNTRASVPPKFRWWLENLQLTYWKMSYAVPITKLECVGHVQKGLGTGLRKLKDKKTRRMWTTDRQSNCKHIIKKRSTATRATWRVCRKLPGQSYITSQLRITKLDISIAHIGPTL